MKRKKRTDNHALTIPIPVPGKSDSRSVAMKKKTSEQLVNEVIQSACEVTGTERLDAADRFIAQAADALVWPKPKDAHDHLIRASAVIAEMAPQNATETMLAVQMIATNDAALLFLRRSTLDQQHSEAVDANVHRATRLMRVFTEQLEAMQKLKGTKCQQKVTVEHVHVHDGGQAIVGAVAAVEPGRGSGG